MNKQAPFSVDGVSIHSKYAPEKQAERFIQNNTDYVSTRTILVVGDGYGYVSAAAKNRFPSAKIISIYVSNHQPDFPHSWWNPFQNNPLYAFLRMNLHYSDLIGLKVLFWPPGCRVLEKNIPSVMEIIHNSIQMNQKELATIGFFGRQFLLHAARKIKRTIIGAEHLIARPPIIATSGPSLDSDLPTLKQFRSKIHLNVVSSALSPLLKAGIIPDSITATDAGFHAAQMLNSLLSHNSNYNLSSIPIICSPQAAIPSEIQNPIILSGDQNSPEGRLLDSAISLPIPILGTVTASAFSALKSAQLQPIFFAGLDLGTHNGKSHAQNHYSQKYSLERNHRFLPLETQSYIRSRGDSSSLEIYRKWFSSYCDNKAGDLWTSPYSASNLPKTTVQQFLNQHPLSNTIPTSLKNLQSQDKSLHNTTSTTIHLMNEEVRNCLNTWAETGMLPHYPAAGLELLVYTAYPALHCKLEDMPRNQAISQAHDDWMRCSNKISEYQNA